jgi:hypothetical protein
MQRHDDDTPVRVPQLEMTPALADLPETDTSEGPRRLHAGDDGESRRHAAISTVSIFGGSRPSGSGSFSK